MANTLSMDQAFIGKLNKILQVNLDKEHFGVKELAQELGLSRSQLHRKLKYLINKTPSRFIREFRLEKAMQMLQNNEATASEIAYRVGFNSPTYFNTCFHDYYGYPPGEVRFKSLGVRKEIRPKIIEEQRNRRTSKIRLFNRRMVWFNAIAILLLGFFGYKLYQKFKAYSTNELITFDENRTSIALIPFKNLSDDRENQYFADGVAGAIQNNLNKISDLRVIPLASMETYRSTDLTPSEIAKEINVQYLLEGSVQKHNDSIRVMANILQAQDNQQIGSFIFDWEFNNIFEIQNQIASEVARELNLNLSKTELEQIQATPTNNIEAYNAYIKGRFLWHKRTKNDLYKSITYFKKAIEIDSSYALAYSGIGDTYYVLGIHDHLNFKSHYNNAKIYISKALTLNNELAEAHATLGGILFHSDWNFEAAEESFIKALSLNPNYESAHQWYAELLMATKRTEKARYHLDLASDINPNSWAINIVKAILSFSEEDFEETIKANNRCIEINKLGFWPYWLNFQAYHQLGKNEESITELSKIFEMLHPEMSVGLKIAYKTEGIKGVYTYINDDLLNEGIQDVAEFNPHRVAYNYAYLGATDKALEWLEFGLEQGHPEMANLLIYPYFKSLYYEPRFQEILSKVGLDKYL